jgi:hypothetical protein
VAEIKRPAAQVVELDELHSYVGHKKTIAGSGLLLIDLGNASSMLSLAPEACRRAQHSGPPSRVP